MSSLMARLAKTAGYCCLTEMLRSNELLSGKQFSSRLGVAQSTISYWRSQASAGVLPYCPKCPPPRKDRKPLKARSRADDTPAA